MFIRVKNIKKKRYAYLVKNIWNKRKKRSRQKIIRYLGPVITIEKTSESLNELKDIGLYPSNKIFKDLITLELINHNFKNKRRRLSLDDIEVNLPKNKVTKSSQPVVLELNEGFLCDYTLTKLFNFKTKSFDPKKEGLRLANTVLQAGITIDQETFITLFNKIYKKA